MKRKKIIFLAYLLIFFISKHCFPYFKIAADKTSIIFFNNNKISNGYAYLVWFDRDSNKFLSLKGKKWIKGISPISNSKISILKFDGKITNLPEFCPDNHSCFIGCAFVYDNDSYDISIFPLSEKAARERLPGQWFFLPNNNNNEQMKEIAPLTTQKSETEVEKPDIYKYDNNSKLLLYANRNAQLFEVIDISKTNDPEVLDFFKLNSNPKEIYKVYNYYIVISENTKDYLTYTTSFILENGKLTLIDNISTDGLFLQSRRRNNIIYTVSKLKNNETDVCALRIDKNGKITKLKEENFQDYANVVAIFNDYLILTFKNFYNYKSELIRVISIKNSENPIGNEYKIEINGYIPSDRHIFIKDHYLMFVSSPTWQNFSKGSTFHVYRIDNTSIEKISDIKGIAPNEQLYATLFTSNRAYIVTFKRKDPLWVIDISYPENPEIVGELKLPGWSEKLFINNNRLLSVGYLENLVSIALFDVSVPENPTLLSRLTPLENEVKYTYSEATSDERAFYINWQNRVAALPINSWYNDYYHFVQAIGIDNKTLLDLGLSHLPFSAKRTFWIDKNYIAALSSRELTIFKENNGKLKLLSRIPIILAADLIGEYNKYIAIISKGSEIYRLYLKNNDSIKDIPIDGCFLDVVFDKNKEKILFFNLNPLKFMLFQNDNFFTKNIEEQLVKFQDFNRLNPYLTDNYVILPIFYYSKNPEVLKYPFFLKNIKKFNFYGIELYKLPDFEKSGFFTIPGRPAGVTENNELITYETGKEKDSLRINLLKINNFSLSDSIELKKCNYFSSQVYVGNKKIYVKCGTHKYYYLLKSNKNMPQPVGENETKIYEISVTNGKFKILRSFKISGENTIIKINEDNNLMLTSAQIYRVYSIWFQPECKLYKITDKLELIKKFKGNCYNPNNVILKKDKIIIGNGEKGLEEIEINE